MISLSQIKQGMIDDILALRDDIKFVEGDPQTDVVVTSPATQFYRYEVLLELENRTRSFTEFEKLINDENFKQSVVDALDVKEDGTPYTLDDVEDLISDRLDAFVSNFDIQRSSGSKATGIVRVYLSNATAVSWDTSTTFYNTAGTSYVATSTIASIIPNFDSTTGLYYVDIPIEASVTGSDGNAVAGAITSMASKPSNFSHCLNQTTVDGGSDEENDLELIARAETVWVDRFNGSLGGDEQTAKDEDYVDDAVAFDEDNEDEDVYVGSVCDVFTQFVSEDTALVEETRYWPGRGGASIEQFDFTPNNQPMLDGITPMVFLYLADDTEVQITSTSDGDRSISVVKDTGTFSESTKANDKVRVKTAVPMGLEDIEGVATNDGDAVASPSVNTLQDTSVNFLALGIRTGITIYNDTDGSSGTITAVTDTTITAILSGGTADEWTLGDAWRIDKADLVYQRKMKIMYAYDKSPYKLQAVFDDKDARMVGPEVLVRKATEVPIRVIVELEIAFGYETSDVQAAVTANIQAFFNGGTTSYGYQFARKTIGEDIQHSDIANIILQTEGVASYDTDTFYVINTLTSDINDPTEIKANQYATLLDVLYEYNAAALSNFTASA